MSSIFFVHKRLSCKPLKRKEKTTNLLVLLSHINITLSFQRSFVQESPQNSQEIPAKDMRLKGMPVVRE